MRVREIHAGLTSIVCLATLWALSGAASAQPATAPWPVFHQNAQRTGRADVVGPSSPAVKWTYLTYKASKGSPVIGPDGTVYLGVGRSMCAIDPTEGAEKWCTSINATVSYSSPALAADGSLYVGGRDNELHAIDTADGTLRWTYSVGADGDVSTSPVIGSDGAIYFAGSGQMHRIEADRSLTWVVQLFGPVFTASPALTADQKTVHVGSCHGPVYALNPSDGTELWSLDVGRSIKYSSPVVGDDGAVYVGTDKGLAAISPNGTLRWLFLTLGSVQSTPALASDGTIYVGSRGRGRSKPATFYAISPEGEPLWTYETGRKWRGSPVIDGNGTIYATSGASVLAFRPDGQLLWEYETGRTILGSPALGGDGTLYVPSGDRNLYAFGP